MPGIDYPAMKKIFDTHQSKLRLLQIELQPAGIQELKVLETDLPVFNNILTSEAHELLKIANASSVAVWYADAADVNNWWNTLKESYTTDIKHLSFVMTNLGDSTTPNLGAVPNILVEAVGKMIAMKSERYQFYCSEKSFNITCAGSQKYDPCQPQPAPRMIRSISIDLLGDWNMNDCYAEILSNILKDRLPKIKKIFLVFNFQCWTCSQRIFEKLGWPFPKVTGDPRDFYTWHYMDTLDFDANFYAQKMTNYNRFYLPPNDNRKRSQTEQTRVHFFYGLQIQEGFVIDLPIRSYEQ